MPGPVTFPPYGCRVSDRGFVNIRHHLNRMSALRELFDHCRADPLVDQPFALRFLFAARPDALAKALEIIYRLLATHLAHKAGFTGREAATGAVTLVQRFGSALNLNIHLHMLCLDGVYAPRRDGGLRFRRVKAPDREEQIGRAHV